MITLITYLTYPKTMTFHGLNYETLRAMKRFVDGPNYALTGFIDIALVAIAAVGIYMYIDHKIENKRKSSSKTEG